MNAEDYLYSCVEAGIAIAGFAAIALALRSQADRGFTAYERWIRASLIERSLVAALLASVPLLLTSFEIPSSTVWPACSALFCIYWTTLLVRSVRARRHPDAQDVVSRVANALLLTLGILVVLPNLVTVLPLGIARGPHWYLLAVTWLLFSAGYMFWFIVRAWLRAA